jgi:RNA polymerase sigma factor (sigma-70 family)
MDPRDERNSSNENAGTSAGEWAGRLRAGDSDAVRHVRQRVQKILRYRGLRIPVQDREDLTQEVMTEVWQAVNRPGFDFAAGFWGFVEVVTARRCIDWIRAQRRASRQPEDLQRPSATPLQETLSNERLRLASQAVAALDPACRQLILLRLQRGLSYKQMAQELGRTEGALRVQMYRCIRKAQQFLTEAEGSSDPKTHD